MSKFSNWGPLFLIEAERSYETPHHIHTCSSFEQAVGTIPSLAETMCSVESIRVRAVQPGPGSGVTVARFESRTPEVNWPMVKGPDGWEVEADGPPEVVQDWELLRLFPQDPVSGEYIDRDRFLGTETVLWERVL